MCAPIARAPGARKPSRRSILPSCCSASRSSSRACWRAPRLAMPRAARPRGPDRAAAPLPIAAGSLRVRPRSKSAFHVPPMESVRRAGTGGRTITGYIVDLVPLRPGALEEAPHGNPGLQLRRAGLKVLERNRREVVLVPAFQGADEFPIELFIDHKMAHAAGREFLRGP